MSPFIYSWVESLSFGAHYVLNDSKGSEDDAGSNHDTQNLADEGRFGSRPACGVEAHTGGDAADNHEDDNTHYAH